MAKNPPNPKTLNKPIPHDGHAGAIKLTKTLDEVALRFHLTCLFTNNTVIAVAIPARTNIMKSSIMERAVIDASIPAVKEKSNGKEKSEKSIR